MATLAQIDEKLGAARRELTEAADKQEQLFASIDNMDSQIDALSSKSELTADESKTLATLKADYAASVKESRTLANDINKINAKMADLSADRDNRVALNAAKEIAERPQPRHGEATPAAPAARVNVKDASKEELSLDIGEWMRAQYLAKRGNTTVNAVLGGERGYEDFRNDRLAAAVNQTNNAALLPPGYRPILVEFLRAQSVVRRMAGTRSIPMPNGTLDLPRQNAASTAYYVNEATNATLSDVTTERISLAAKKLVVSVVQTGEILRRSDPQSAALVRDDMVEQLRLKEDVTFLRNSTAGSPYGLKYVVDNFSSAVNRVDATIVGSLTPALARQDLGKVMLKLANGNVPNRNRYWVLSPRSEQFLMDYTDSNGNYVFPEMQRGMLRSAPYLTTTQIPDNLNVTIGSARPNSSEIYYVESSEIIIGDTPTFDLAVSDTAAYHDGTNVQAAFSRDEVVFRLMVEHDLKMRHDVSVSYMQGVNWGS